MYSLQVGVVDRDRKNNEATNGFYHNTSGFGKRLAPKSCGRNAPVCFRMFASTDRGVEKDSDLTPSPLPCEGRGKTILPSPAASGEGLGVRAYKLPT